MTPALPIFLREQPPRLLLFGGKGGVGKTTCAMATALGFARRAAAEFFMLVSTDPAHSALDSLAGSPLPPNLKIIEINAQDCLESFKNKNGEKLRRIASRGTFLDDDDVNSILQLSLPGLDELMAFLEIARWVGEEEYSCIVVDTAPTGHTLRLLAMPELLSRWLGALEAMLSKHRYMKRVYSGLSPHDDLDEFLATLASAIDKMENLLRDPAQCCFVPVTLAEALAVSETRTLVRELEERRILVDGIMVNRLLPDNSCRVCAAGRSEQMRELGRLAREMPRYRLWGIPLYPGEVRGPQSLDTFWNGVRRIDNSSLDLQERTISGLPSEDWIPDLGRGIEDPPGIPAPPLAFLLFAGKGGVGKTTLACATALRLAHERRGRRVFLFSADPAHSLSECLGVKVGPQPTEVIPGLTAMEIDAQAEFESLKAAYAEELEEFFQSVLPNLDLAFDREVMERIMDLSPPGLDEVMAFARAMELLAEGRYEVFILDSAPTGHLIRFLELPQLVDQWLKALFNLLLKYRRLFRLPNVSVRLIELSKKLKQLKALLGDPDKAALYAVSILTEMAFEETKDLLAACGRIGIHTPMLFLNLTTPPGDCSLCSAMRRLETDLRRRFRDAFPAARQVLVCRQQEPRGLERLLTLGQMLYQDEGVPQKKGGVLCVEKR